MAPLLAIPEREAKRSVLRPPNRMVPCILRLQSELATLLLLMESPPNRLVQLVLCIPVLLSILLHRHRVLPRRTAL